MQSIDYNTRAQLANAVDSCKVGRGIKNKSYFKNYIFLLGKVCSSD